MLHGEDLKALIATCDKGQDFESRRDAALVRLFIDTGGRLSETQTYDGCPLMKHRVTSTWTGGQLLASARLKELTESPGDIRFGER